MKNLIFLCHDNICLSPMAECIMENIIKDNGLENEFHIDSAAAVKEEFQDPIYPPAERKLKEHKIPVKKHLAHQITVEEFDKYDYVIVMENYNLTVLSTIVGLDKVNNEKKVHMILEFAGDEPVSREAAADLVDPWYTGDFEVAYQNLLKGCSGLLAFLKKQQQKQ